MQIKPSANAFCFHCVQESLLINNSSKTCIDHGCAWSQGVEKLFSKESIRVFVCRHADADDIGQLGQIDQICAVINAKCVAPLLGDVATPCHNVHSKCTSTPRDLLANLSESDDSQGSPRQSRCVGDSVSIPLTSANGIHLIWKLAITSQDQSPCQFSNSHRASTWAMCDEDSSLACGVDIDMIG